MFIVNNKSIFTILVATIAIISILVGFSACKKDVEAITGTGVVSVEFDNLANDNTLVLGDNYINANGDVMKFSTFNYYVSNFSLVKTDGSIYTVPKDSCYFLIKEMGGENTAISLKNIPAGDYKEIRFIVGVDSLKSAAPISERKGVLDPTGNAMYWTSNNGYIFVNAEGTSPQAPLNTTTNNHDFRYQIGLFGGISSPTINNIKKISLSGGDAFAKVRTELTPEFHVTVDIMEIFKTPTVVSVATNPIVMAIPYSATLANNYVDMFKLEHIHN